MRVFKTAQEPDLVIVPEDYLPDEDTLVAIGTHKCPICTRKWWYFVPQNIGTLFEEWATSAVSEEMYSSFDELMMSLAMSTDPSFTEDEVVHLLTGTCVGECQNISHAMNAFNATLEEE